MQPNGLDVAYKTLSNTEKKMNRPTLIIVLFACFCLLAGGIHAPVFAGAGGPSVPSKWTNEGTDSITPVGDKAVVYGNPVTVVDTQYPVVEVLDANGEVLASITVTCTDLTDASEDCNIKFYGMIAGVLTLMQTLSVAE